MRFTLILSCFALACSIAQANPPQQLFFPIGKSSIQALPQRFEYQLLDKDQIRIGNVLVNTQNIDFQITPISGAKNRYKLVLQWPAGLLTQGEVAIKDNSGKAIWFQKILPDQVRLSDDGSLAHFETETEVPSLMRLIRLYPFFHFCVHREEPLNKTYLCSKDLYLRKSDNGIAIEKKDSHRPQSFIEINGRPVGNQGMIFLNSPSEFVSLRALLLSGATLEIDTRMKDVDFKDAFLSPDGKELVIQAQGAEPMDLAGVEQKDGGEWQTRLRVERPTIYMKGEGDLPLRQDFLIKGPVRRADSHVSVAKGAGPFVFRKEADLLLKPAPGWKLTPADQRTGLQSLAGGEYRWTLTDLEINNSNRRYIKVSNETESYIAAYDLARMPAFDASLRLMLPLWLQAGLLYTPSGQWGFNLQHDKLLQKSDSEPEISGLLAGLLYRRPSGVHLRDSAISGEVYVQSLQTDIKSFAFYGVGLQAELKSPAFWSGKFPVTFFKLRYPVGLSDSDYKIKTGYDAELSLRLLPSNVHYWEIGARSYSFTLEDRSGSSSGLGATSGDIKSEKTLGFLGFGWLF